MTIKNFHDEYWALSDGSLTFTYKDPNMDLFINAQKMLEVLTLLVPLITGILQRQADRAVVPCAVLPVGDDLPGRCTVGNCKVKQNRIKTSYSAE